MADLTKEWDKATPVAQSDWDKATPINDLSVRKLLPGDESISATGAPPWMHQVAPYARTGLEILGLIGAAGPGYAAAKEVGNLLPGNQLFIPPPAQGTAEPVNKQLADWKVMGLSKVDAEKALKRPIPDEEWNMSNPPSLFPTGSIPGKIFNKAGEVSRNIAEGQAMEIGGQYAGKLLPRVLPMYARGRTAAAEEVANIANREGVTIPAADITGSIGQSAITSSVQKLPQSAKVMQDESVKAVGQFSNLVERNLGRLGGRVEPSEAGILAKESVGKPFAQSIESQFTGGQVPPLLHGQGTQEAIVQGLKNAQTTAKGFYDQAVSAAKETPVTFDKIASAIEKVQGSDRYKLLSESGKKEVDNFISLIKERTIPKVGEIKVPTGGGATVPMQVSQGGGKGFIDRAALEGVAKEGNVITKFLDAEGFRKSLADKVYSRGAKDTEAYGPMRDIYKAFEEDMATSAKTAGNEASTAFKNARDFWAKDVVGTFGAPGERNFLTKISDASPEQVVNILKKATTDELSQLAKAIPKESLPNIKNGILSSIVNEGSSKSATGEILYNGPRIARELQTMGSERLSTLFSKDEVRYLRDLALRGTKSVPLFKIGNQSAEYALSRLKNAPLEEVGLIRRNLSSDEFLQYRQGFLTQLFEKHSKTSPITNGIIYDGPQIAKELFGKGGLGEARVKLMTTPEEFTFLKEMSKVGEKMGASWRIAGQPSGTAHTLYVLHLLGQAGATAGAAVAGEQLGGKKTAAAAAIGAFLAPYAVAKLITSNIGRRYLISGFPAMEKAVSRVLPAGIVATRGVLGGQEPERLSMPTGARKKESQ